jgi:molybdopterin synthase sulfur carrier subunit
MIVHIPSPLRSYTGNRAEVEAAGRDLDALLDDLDRRFPGIRFRMIDEQGTIREHIRLFVDGQLAQDLHRRLDSNIEVQIICAISGG